AGVTTSRYFGVDVVRLGDVFGGFQGTWADVLRGTCTEHGKPGLANYSLSCSGGGSGPRIPDRAFRMDSLLRSARVEFRYHGSNYTASWKASARLEPGFWTQQSWELGCLPIPAPGAGLTVGA